MVLMSQLHNVIYFIFTSVKDSKYRLLIAERNMKHD